MLTLLTFTHTLQCTWLCQEAQRRTLGNRGHAPQHAHHQLSLLAHTHTFLPPTHLHCSARGFAKKLNDAPLAIVDKRRSAHNVSEVMNLIGDVRGKVAVLVDDMIDTAGTISQAAKILRQVRVLNH